jgi:hypothetical protein
MGCSIATLGKIGLLPEEERRNLEQDVLNFSVCTVSLMSLGLNPDDFIDPDESAISELREALFYSRYESKIPIEAFYPLESKMNINERISLLSPPEQESFYRAVLDNLSDPKWREQYGINTDSDEGHERAKEIVYGERYHGYTKPILEKPREAESISLKDLECLAK